MALSVLTLEHVTSAEVDSGHMVGMGRLRCPELCSVCFYTHCCAFVMLRICICRVVLLYDMCVFCMPVR